MNQGYETVGQERVISEKGNVPLCLSVPDAARLLGVSRNTGYAMAKMGQLPTIRCGKRRILVPKAALMARLQAREIQEPEQEVDNRE